MKLLPEWRDANPNLLDTNDRTYYMLLSLSGRESIVRLLLERAVAKPNSADTDGRTPLSFAAARGYHPAVMLLLERNRYQSPSPENRRCSESTLGTPKFRSPFKRGPQPGGGERTPEPEEKEPLPVLEEVTPHIIDDFPLGASVSLSVLLRSPPELPHCSSRLSLTIWTHHRPHPSLSPLSQTSLPFLFSFIFSSCCSLIFLSFSTPYE